MSTNPRAISRRIRERLASVRECKCRTSGCYCYSPALKKHPECAECRSGWHVNANGEPWEENRS